MPTHRPGLLIFSLLRGMEQAPFSPYSGQTAMAIWHLTLEESGAKAYTAVRVRPRIIQVQSAQAGTGAMAPAAAAARKACAVITSPDCALGVCK
ncbi:hypothetical protein, partial [Desulfovulcanus sp.]